MRMILWLIKKLLIKLGLIKSSSDAEPPSCCG